MLVNVFSQVLLLSVMSAALIFPICLAKVVFKEKLSPRWHYYIWFILIIRLIIPYTPPLDVHIHSILPHWENKLFAETKDNNEKKLPAVGVSLEKLDQVEDQNENDFGEILVQSERSLPIRIENTGDAQEKKLNLLTLETASIVWLAGLVLILFYFLGISHIMYLKIRTTRISVEDAHIQDILQSCRLNLNIQRDIPIIYQKHIKAPAICGVIRPKLLMPVDILEHLDGYEMRYVILHELCHYKRKDVWMGVLQTVLCAVHWFNPLVWYAFFKMKEDREPVCDAWVLSHIQPHERRNYAETLIKILGYFSENHWIYGTASIIQGKLTNMEWRLKFMNLFKKRSILLAVVITLITVGCSIGGVLVINANLHTTYAADSEVTDPVPEEAPVRGKILDRNGKELAVSKSNGQGSERVYPNNNLASHILGSVGSEGIEQSMDHYLKENAAEARSGKNVVLTIDIEIQKLVENALDKAIADYKASNGAAAIIMDPKSGEILAMASKSDNGRNMNISCTYEPGSLFKAITAAAALEEGIFTADSKVDDDAATVGEYKINCWNPNSHGKETLEQAIWNSCNPVFVRAAQSLGLEKFYNYMEQFGFYEKTGLNLPGETQGMIHKNPMEIDMAVASIGQRIQVTPVQLISAYSAIANDGKLMKPQLIKKITGQDNNIVTNFDPQCIRDVISRKTARELMRMLEGAVSKGVAANAGMDGYQIAGYIGTGEKVNNEYVASFAGFAPANDPEIACMLIVDEPKVNPHTGGMVAAPAAGKLMKEVLDYLAGK